MDLRLDRRARRRFAAWRRPLWALAAAACALIGLEGAARLAEGAAPGEEPGMMVPHPTRIWALRPGRFTLAGAEARIGEDGLRRSAGDGGGPGDGAGPLVLTVGDSSLFGHGVADGAALHDRLQADLQGAWPGARVRCFAVPGYSILQSERLLEEEGWGRRPRLVIVGSLWSDSNVDRFADAELLALLDSPLTRAERVMAGSALFRLSRAGINRALGRPERWRIGWPEVPDRAGRRRVEPADYLAALGRVLDRARAEGSAALLLTMGSRWRLERADAGASWWPYVEAQRRAAAAWSVPLVDAAEVLGAGLPEGGAAALFPDGLHPSAEAHARISAAIAARLSAGWPGLPEPGEVPEAPEGPPGEADPGSPQLRMISGG